MTVARRDYGYIFQAHNLHSSLTALQNVRMGLEVHDTYSAQAMNDRAAKMLETVGLGERINDYPDNLSGGQKQRVALALAKPLPCLRQANANSKSLSAKADATRTERESPVPSSAIPN